MMTTAPTKREMWAKHTRESITRRAVDSLAIKHVRINGIWQDISVAHRTIANEKRIAALPGESLAPGGLVEFAGGKWLITEVDINNEIYERGLMKRCNHILRWISGDGTLKEKWCVVEDGTKYLVGEHSSEMVTIGDARIAVTVGKDSETIELDRGLRFLIDDADAVHPTAYQITKSNRFFNSYPENGGVFRYILNEVVRTDNDNVGERIADFENWLPPRKSDGDFRDSDLTVAQIVAAAEEKVENNPPSDDKERWF